MSECEELTKMEEHLSDLLLDYEKLRQERDELKAENDLLASIRESQKAMIRKGVAERDSLKQERDDLVLEKENHRFLYVDNYKHDKIWEERDSLKKDLAAITAERDELKGRLFDIDVCKSTIASYSDENGVLKKELAEHKRVMDIIMDNKSIDEYNEDVDIERIDIDKYNADVIRHNNEIDRGARAPLADEPEEKSDHPSDGPSSLTIALTNIPMLDFEREIWEADERVYEVTESPHSREHDRIYNVKFRVTKPECTDESEEKSKIIYMECPVQAGKTEWMETFWEEHRKKDKPEPARFWAVKYRGEDLGPTPYVSNDKDAVETTVKVNAHHGARIVGFVEVTE